MTDCLFECLREARLEKYYRSFVNGGLRYCDALLHLSMQEYPKYGVVSMEDRLKLFKLIQIVKSVQAEGLVCQHGHHTHAKQRRQQADTRNNNAVKKQTNVIKGTGQIVKVTANRRQLPQAPHQVPQPEAPRQGRVVSMRQARQPEAPAVRRSTSMRQFNQGGAPAARRSNSATRVEYKPDSDSPIFHCRRHLKFTDSDLESDEDDFPKPTVVTWKGDPGTGASSPSSKYSNVNSTAKQQDSLKTQRNDHQHHTQAQIKTSNTVQSNIVLNSHQQKPLLVVAEPKVRAFNFATDAKPEVSPIDIPEQRLRNNSHPSPYEPQPSKKSVAESKTSPGAFFVEMNPPDSSKQLKVNEQTDVRRTQTSHLQNRDTEKLSSGEKNMVKPSTVPLEYKQHSSMHNVDGSQQMQLTQQHVITVSNTGQASRGPSHAIAYHATQQPANTLPNRTAVSTHINEQSLQTATQTLNMPASASQGGAAKPFQFKNYIPSAGIRPGQHAYFPAAPTQQLSNKPNEVEKIYYGAGYNYGVPNPSNCDIQNKGRTSACVPAKSANNGQAVLGDKIRVCVRKRPLLGNEVKRGEVDIVRTEGSNVVAVDECKLSVDLSRFVQQHIFRFDEVFGANCGNDVVYNRAVKPLVHCAFNKGTATCFAFGQTGSGKSYTLLGNQTVPGLYQLAAHDIFAGFVSWKNTTNVQLHLWVSYYEIYCSQLFDLLNKRKKLHVRENSRGKVCIAGLMETEVHNVKGLVEVVQYGNAARSTGVSGVNPQSSRSHAVLQLEVRDEKDIKQGRMSFIDLAGSERATDMTDTDKQTRMEGAEINQSLLALKECIRSIDQDSRHTPYRQSKLTHILRDSFLGNSRTVMVANVSPCMSTCEHTLNTLRYADRVKELEKITNQSSPKPAGRNIKPATPRLSSANKDAAVLKTKTPNANVRQGQEATSKRLDRPLSSRKLPQEPHPVQAGSVTSHLVHIQNVKSQADNVVAVSLKPAANAEEKRPEQSKNGSHALGKIEGTAQQSNPSIKVAQSNAPVTNEHQILATKTPKSMFMPNKNIYASTPKRESSNLKHVEPLGSPFDVSKILKDEPETPVQGFKMTGERQKTLEDSPEIVPAGSAIPPTEKFEDPPPSASSNKQTIVEDIFTSDSESSPHSKAHKQSQHPGAANVEELQPHNTKIEMSSYSKSQYFSAVADQSKSSFQHYITTNDQSKSCANQTECRLSREQFQGAERSRKSSESENKLHVNADKVSDLVKQQRDALLSGKQSVQVKRPHSAGRERSRGQSPSQAEYAQRRGRSEVRDVTSRDSHVTSLSQRSKSIESLRATLKHRQHSKSTPYLNTASLSPESEKKRHFERIRYRPTSGENHKVTSESQSNVQAWSPRSNHANLRSHLTATTRTPSTRVDKSASPERHGNGPSSVNSRPQSMERSRSGDCVIKSHEEIMAEHREVLDHLDSLLDRAKAAVESPPSAPVPVFSESQDHERPLKSILKNSGHSQYKESPTKLPSTDFGSNGGAALQKNVELSPKLVREDLPSKYEQLMEICDAQIENYGAKTRHSDPVNPLGPDVRPKDNSTRYSLSASRMPNSRQPTTEEFLQSLADIKLPNQRHSISSSGNNTASSSKAATPGEHRVSSGHSSAARTPSSGLVQTGSGFVTPAAAPHLIGYVSGNDVVLISDQDPGFGGSPMPCSTYVPPPAPKKTNASVNRSVNDLGFKGELERMERCSSQNSDRSLTGKNRSWHDILSQSDDDGSLSDKKQCVSNHHSREGSLELATGGVVKQKATIKDIDTVVIETQIEQVNGRSTVDSGIGTHRDHSDPDAERRTNSRSSHYSLDLHSDPDTVDDGISLSTDTAQTHPKVAASAHSAQLPVDPKRKGRSSKSVPKRRMEPEEDEDYIPPLKLNFDDEDDELEESYCRIVESEKRREAEERAKRRLQVHHDSAFTVVHEPVSADTVTAGNEQGSKSAEAIPGTSQSHANAKASSLHQEHEKYLTDNTDDVSKSQSIKSQAGAEFSPIQSFPITPRDSHVVSVPTAVSKPPTSNKKTSTPPSAGLVDFLKSEKERSGGDGSRASEQATLPERQQGVPQEAQGHLEPGRVHGPQPGGRTSEQATLAGRPRGAPQEPQGQHGRIHGTQPPDVSQHVGTMQPKPVLNGSAQSQAEGGQKSGVTMSQVEEGGVTDRRSGTQVALPGQQKAVPSSQHTHLQHHLMVSHEEQLAQMTALCKQEMKLLMAVKASNQDFTAYVKGLEEILSDKGRCILHLKAKIDDYLKATTQA